MRAGLLNRRISIQSPSVTSRSTDGEPIVSWSTIVDTVWADRQPVDSREMFALDVRWANITRRYTIRYTTVAVSPEDRLIDLDESSAAYDIKAVIDVNDRHECFELLVERTT